MQRIESTGSSGDQPMVGRRRIIRFLLSFSIISTLVGVLTPVFGYLWPPVRSSQAGSGRVLVGSLLDIPRGQGKILPVGNRPIVVVHTKDGQVRAFSAVCTHLACVVEWDEARQFILCPCHDGRFNALTGAVISGPAPSPLPPMEVAIDGNDIYVGGV
jgi:cytochrome b6-f complex iron-sulfur subunit